MNLKEELAHSEAYFHDGRNYWYNTDFLELMAKRWQLGKHNTLLDIGCGMCHWSKLLLPFLNASASVVALDNETKWAEGSPEIEQYFLKHDAEINFVKSDAHKLPFPDNSFDVVTCQTVLIHLKNPEKALSEMKRVVKSNGIVICAEPNNLVQAILKDSVNRKETIETSTERFEATLALEQLKQMDGNGNNSFGDLLTGTMNKLGFREIQSYLNDKLTPIYPPYEKPEQFAAIDYFLNDIENNNSESPIQSHIKNGNFYHGGGTMLYLVSGRK